MRTSTVSNSAEVASSELQSQRTSPSTLMSPSASRKGYSTSSVSAGFREYGCGSCVLMLPRGGTTARTRWVWSSAVLPHIRDLESKNASDFDRDDDIGLTCLAQGTAPVRTPASSPR